MTTHDHLHIWTIYEHPLDYPEWFVARLGIDGIPTDRGLLGRTLEEVREKLPQGLYRIARHPQDDPVIVESWL